MVDGTSGPCGGGGPQFTDGEVPGGTVDGTNATFTLANPPTSGHAAWCCSAMASRRQPGTDYTLTGSSIQFLAGAIPQPGDTLLAWYRLPAAGSIGGRNGAGPADSVQRGGDEHLFDKFHFARQLHDSGERAARPEIEWRLQFDLAHAGTTAGFEFKVFWGSTVLVDRVAAARRTLLIAGKGEAGGI